MDLYGVDFGELPEASALLVPYMRAYCHSDPARVTKFAAEMSYYGYAGSLAHFAYKTLKCKEADSNADCEEPKKKKEEWMAKLFKFLKKMEVYKQADTNPVFGLYLDMRDGLDELFDQELDKVPPTPLAKPPAHLFDKVYNHIIAKLYNLND